MRWCRSWYRIHQLLQARLPLTPGPLADSLALWLQGLLRQGAACLRRLLARNRLWARVWLTPTPGPNRVAGLHCLSPPTA